MFFPTRLALHLSSAPAASFKELAEEGFVIVESTFKLYAYTSSKYQIVGWTRGVLFVELVADLNHSH